MNLGLRPENKAATQSSVGKKSRQREQPMVKGFGRVKDQKGNHTRIERGKEEMTVGKVDRNQRPW